MRFSRRNLVRLIFSHSSTMASSSPTSQPPTTTTTTKLHYVKALKFEEPIVKFQLSPSSWKGKSKKKKRLRKFCCSGIEDKERAVTWYRPLPLHPQPYLPLGRFLLEYLKAGMILVFFSRLQREVTWLRFRQWWGTMRCNLTQTSCSLGKYLTLNDIHCLRHSIVRFIVSYV